MVPVHAQSFIVRDSAPRDGAHYLQADNDVRGSIRAVVPGLAAGTIEGHSVERVYL